MGIGLKGGGMANLVKKASSVSELLSTAQVSSKPLLVKLKNRYGNVKLKENVKTIKFALPESSLMEFRKEILPSIYYYNQAVEYRLSVDNDSPHLCINDSLIPLDKSAAPLSILDSLSSHMTEPPMKFDASNSKSASTTAQKFIDPKKIKGDKP